MIRVLVVDDHPLVRTALLDLIDTADDLVAVGGCGDGAEVVGVALRTRPDVVLMDLTMPVVDGFQATRALRAALPTAQVIMLTAAVGARSERAAQAAGVFDYLAKTGDAEALLRAVRMAGALCTPALSVLEFVE